MTYVSWTNAQIDDARWIKAGGLAGWVHTCALVYCDKQRTTERLEGGGEPDWEEDRISRDRALTIAPGVSLAATKQAITRLVRLGFWEKDGRDYYRLVDFAEHTLDADSLQHMREKDREKKTRQRHHKDGIHDYCHKWDCAVLRGEAKPRAAKPRSAKPRTVKPVAAKPRTKSRSKVETVDEAKQEIRRALSAVGVLPNDNKAELTALWARMNVRILKWMTLDSTLVPTLVEWVNSGTDLEEWVTYEKELWPEHRLRDNRSREAWSGLAERQRILDAGEHID